MRADLLAYKQFIKMSLFGNVHNLFLKKKMLLYFSVAHDPKLSLKQRLLTRTTKRWHLSVSELLACLWIYMQNLHGDVKEYLQYNTIRYLYSQQT